MAKKGRGKTYLVGGIVVIVALAVLLVDFDDLGNLTPLAGSGDLTFDIPIQNSLLPPSSGFSPFDEPTSYTLGLVECKIKQETKVYDVNGKLSRTIQSSGIQGTPQVQLSLFTPANVEVSHYTVVPKIFCVVDDRVPVPIFIKPSDLTVQVYAQTNPASEQRNLVFSQNLRTFQYSFPSPPNQVAEPSLGVVTIRASDIEPSFQNQNFDAQLEFRVFGTLNLEFESGFTPTKYEIPISENNIRSFYVQPVRVDQVPDRDLDGIVDEFDQCPDQAENFNNFEDTDGCPDILPTTQPTPPPTPICTVSCPITNQVDCNNQNQTWMINTSGGGDVCFGGALTTQGSFCKVYDSVQSKCIDPDPSSTSNSKIECEAKGGEYFSSLDSCVFPTGTTEQDNKDECSSLKGVYRSSSGGLVITKVFTQDELEGGTTREFREGSSSTITAYCLIPSGFPTFPPLDSIEKVVAFAKDGKIVSQITITFTDRSTEVFLASESSSFKQGSVDNPFPIASIVGTTTSGEEKVISTIKYSTYYVRDTLAEAQRLKLTGSEIEIIPVVRVEGSSTKYTLTPSDLGGHDTGLIGHSVLGGSEFGFLLGTKTFTSSLIESPLPSSLSGERKLSLSISTVGEIRVLSVVDGISAKVSVKGEELTLNGFLLNRTIVEKLCPPDQILSSKNICIVCPDGTEKIDNRTCEPVAIICTLPKVQLGNGCEIPEDELTLEECHNDFVPPREVLGNVCRIVPTGGTNQICSDSHTTHTDFPCTIEYRIEICGGATSTQCGLPVKLVCDPDEVIIGEKCEKIAEICKNGETPTLLNQCVVRPNEGYCTSVDKIYISTTNSCDDPTVDACEDDSYFATHQDECKTDNICESPRVMSGDFCHDPCLSNQKFSTTSGVCEELCPSGTTRNGDTGLCEIPREGDRDNDGFPDNVDACPDQYGSRLQGSTNGCPVCIGGGCDDDLIRDLFNNPLLQIGLVVFIILIGTVVIIRRRSSF